MIEEWHRFVESGDIDLLKSLLADDAVFHSPAVHTPQRGKPLVTAYLLAAYSLLGPAGFRYVNEWRCEYGAVLEFEAELNNTYVNGVDVIRWNEAGNIVDFKVMLRPERGLAEVKREMMSRMSS